MKRNLIYENGCLYYKDYQIRINSGYSYKDSICVFSSLEEILNHIDHTVFKNSIDWLKVPLSDNFIAMDFDGGWRSYATEPYIFGSMWTTGNDHSFYTDLSIFPDYQDNWKKSLVKRPNV